MRSTGPVNTLDRLYRLATRLPWWGGLLSALTAYALLHPIAMLQMPAPAGTVDVAATALAQLFVFLAQIGQYFLPLAFLASATVSGFDRWKRGNLRNSVAQDTSGSILRGLPWPDFELLVSESFRRRGFEISAAGTGSPNAGKGLQLTRNDRCFLVDCTDWRSWRAGAAAIRKLHEYMAMTGAHGGFAVTSGQFTPEAKHFAAGKNIELIDGRHLKELVRSKPQATQGGRPPPVEGLQSALSRWRDRLVPFRRPAPPKTYIREPRIWPDANPLPEARVRPIRKRTAARLLLAEGAEKTAGEQLTALIREERDIGNEIAFCAPPVQVRDTPGPGRRRPRPRIQVRRVADILGFLLAIGVLLSTHEWLLQLPNAPTDTPWSLLGAGSDSDLLARRLEGIERSASGGRLPDGERPLGEFQFGPPGRIADLPSRARNQGTYGSLRELEAAFDAKYVPPPECYAWESNSQMVKCGNHRIRTRRAFIASGGEETPMLLGTWEDPSDNWRPYEQWVQQQGGEGDQAWQPYAPEEQGQDWYRGGEQDVAQPRVREYALEPNRDWRSEDARNSGWHPPRQDELAQSPQSGWRSGYGQDRERDWRQEFARDWGQERVEKPQLSPQQDWRQDWVRAPEREADRDWRRDWSRQPAQDHEPDPSQDWRQNWLQVP